MANPFLDYATALRDALRAAGLNARTFADPDTGRGSVVEFPTITWDPALAGCGRVNTGAVEIEVRLVGAGYAPEQLEQRLAQDAATAWEAIPFPWRVTRIGADPSADLPAVTLTVNLR